MKARAIENMSYTVGVNRVGQDGNGFAYNGCSKVYDTLGEEISNFELSTTQTQVIVLDKLKQDILRKTLGFLNDIRMLNWHYTLSRYN